MPFQAIFKAIEATPAGVIMRENAVAFPLVECIHVVSLTFVVGTIALVDLRLLGLGNRDRSVTHLSGDILPVTWTAFVCSLISGGLMFTSQAVHYSENLPFQLKMACMALAAVNMLYFHFVTWRSVGSWDRRLPTPVAVKIAGGLSLLFWFGVVAFGRWIGFT